MPHRITQDQRHKNYLARVMQQRLHPESTPSSIPAQQFSNTSLTPQSLTAGASDSQYLASAVKSSVPEGGFGKAAKH